MRRGRNGLSALVQEAMKLDPFGSGLFVFVGRRRNQTTFSIPFVSGND